MSQNDERKLYQYAIQFGDGDVPCGQWEGDATDREAAVELFCGEYPDDCIMDLQTNNPKEQ